MQVFFDFQSKTDELRKSISDYFLTQFQDSTGFDVYLKFPPNLLLRHENGVVTFRNEHEKWTYISMYVGFEAFLRQNDPTIEHTIESTIFVDIIADILLCPTLGCQVQQPIFSFIDEENKSLCVYKSCSNTKYKLNFATNGATGGTIDVQVASKKDKDDKYASILSIESTVILPDLQFILDRFNVQFKSVLVKDLQQNGLKALSDITVYVIAPSKILAWGIFQTLAYNGIYLNLKLAFCGYSLDGKNIASHAFIEASSHDILTAEPFELFFLYGSKLRLTDQSINKKCYDLLTEIANKYQFVISYELVAFLTTA